MGPLLVLKVSSTVPSSGIGNQTIVNMEEGTVLDTLRTE